MHHRSALADEIRLCDAPKRTHNSDGVAGADTPESLLSESEGARCIRALIGGLSRPHWAVITLIYDDGFTQAQIAEALEVSPAAVSKMHRLAIERLRTGLLLMGIHSPEDL